MSILLPRVAAAVTLIERDIAAGRISPPGDETAFVRAVEFRWPRVTGPRHIEPATDYVALNNLLHTLWMDSGGWPVDVPWGELVADPFRERRAEVDLAQEWPDEETTPDLGGPPAYRFDPTRPAIAFPDVHKDGRGYWTAPAALPGILVGTEIGDPSDAAVVPRTYWRVVAIAPERIDLAPIPPNPLVTGRGAGGATITDHDLQVLSGAYESRRIARIREKEARGEASIDDLTYLLLGTVPTQMGPNGAQGGWYNPSDTRATRGGRQGLTPQQVSEHDARWLHRRGYAVPALALTDPFGLSVDEWDAFIKGPVRDFPIELSPEPELYIEWLRQMSEPGGRFSYSEDSLAERLRRSRPESLKLWLDTELQSYLDDPAAWRSENYRDYVKNLGDFADWAAYQANDASRRRNEWLVVQIPGEDLLGAPFESVSRHLYHPERRVSVRNAAALAHMLILEQMDSRAAGYWRELALAWLVWGGADYLAYEQLLNTALYLEDIELLVAALDLPEADNRRKVIDNLVALGQLDQARQAAARDDEPEVLRALLSAVAYGKHEDPHLAGDLVLELDIAGRAARLPAQHVLGSWTDYQWQELAVMGNRLLSPRITEPEAQAAAHQLKRLIEGRWRAGGGETPTYGVIAGYAGRRGYHFPPSHGRAEMAKRDVDPGAHGFREPLS